MSRALVLSLAVVLLASGQALAGSSLNCMLMSPEGRERMALFLAELAGAPPEDPAETARELDLPVGKWKVAYSNGVTEVCETKKDGTALVVEPVRIPGRQAAASETSVVILFENGRAQRWTPIGERLVVEHWFPGSALRTTTPEVLGIAERVE